MARARKPDSGGRLRRTVPFALLGAVMVLAAGCGAIAHMTANEGNPVAGKQVFLSGSSPSCSACHTLAAAGSTGAIGPNLDAAFGPDRCQGFALSTIKDVIRGQIAYADSNPGVDYPPNSTTTVPGMPANLVTGQKAADVAAYVASVAGVTHGPGPHWNCATGSETTG